MHVSVLERCPSYRESNKGSKERQGPTLSVRFTEVSVKRESTVSISINKIDLDFLYWHADFICFLPTVNPLDFECIPSVLDG